MLANLKVIYIFIIYVFYSTYFLLFLNLIFWFIPFAFLLCTLHIITKYYTIIFAYLKGIM